MKKILSLFLITIFICSPAFAGKRVISKKLTVSGSPITSYAIASGDTVYSDGIYQQGNVGFSSMEVTVSGDVDISYQVSRDNSTWYAPNITDGTTLLSVGGIVSSLTTSKWIVLPAKLSPYVRYVFESDALTSSTISATVVWQDEY